MKLYAVFPLAMGLVCASVALYELLIWVRCRAELYELAFAVTCIMAALYDAACAGGYDVDTPLQSLPWLRAQAIALNLTGLSFLWYLAGRTGEVKRGVLFAFVGWSLFSVGAQVAGFGSLTWNAGMPKINVVHLPLDLTVVYREVGAGPLTAAQYAAGLLLLIYLFWVVRRYARNGHPFEARRLAWLLGVVCAAYLNDFAVSFQAYSFLYTVEYAWVAALVFVGLERSADLVEASLARRALATSLQEKTVLLKEIHHRVKNNLQVISSLLYLQGARLAGNEAQAAIMSSRNQILSMALVHEDLYRSGDFGHIDFGDYLHRLVTRLIAAYRVEGGIAFLPALGHLSLGVDQAIPCGLIVNELCTNVLKHAFPRDHACKRRELQVELAGGDGSVTLAVADNGVGMPSEIVPESATTLGMQIVSRLVKQLNGTMRMVSDGTGSRFEIAFPVGS